MLICSSEEGIPTPSYSWEKLDALPRLPHNAMQGITNKLAVGVPFCPTFAGKSHKHSLAQTQQQSHHHRHLSCARPELLPTRRSPTPLILLRGDDGWMEWFKPCESESEHVCQECLFVCGVFMLFLLLSCWIPTLTHFWLIPNTCHCFVLDWCNHYGHASTLAKWWPDTHPAPLRITGAGVSELRLVFSIREQWCSGLSFLFQLCPLHSQIISITSHFLWLYTTGQ